MATASRPSVPGAPSARPTARAWFVLAILCFVYVLNFLDRQLLSILAKPIQDDLGVTDGQLGLISGLYFALFYCVLAIPVGWLADRTNRVRVLALACALWSAATAACGLSQTYPQLAVSRMAVGIGEAGGVPPSYAIISDYFPSGTRGTALSLFNLGPPIGSALGVAFGASIAAAYSWRDAFLWVGVAGVVTAVVVWLFVREPKKGGLDAAPEATVPPEMTPKAGFWSTCRMYFANPVLRGMALACGATQFVTYALLNFATLFLMREKGMTLEEIAVWYALLVGVAVSLGMFVSGRLVDRLARRFKTAYAYIPAIGLAVAMPFFAGFIWAPDWRLALAFLALPMGLNYFYLSSAVTLVQEEVRPDQRVLSGALLLLVMNLIGLGLGPTYLGAASDFFQTRHPDHSLQMAFYTLLPFYGLAVLMFLGLAGKIRRQAAKEGSVMKIGLRALAAVFALGCALMQTPAWAQAVVDAPAGSLRGETVDGVDVFRGIPYAAPPTGWRRWRPPAEAPRWRGTRDATRFGAACHQPVARGESIYAGEAPTMSEDCLFLNVWRPENAHGAPVFVWIHGGALNTGAGSEPMYDGARLAASQGLVVVSINYRLGVLGYLAHPELSAESRRHVSGNYGLLDQIAALKWVEANIAAFGGDPANVTIAGESAGALSVMYLMASPQARGLFDRAIAESAYMISTPELRSRRYGDPPAEGVGVWLQAQLGLRNLAEMRAMDAQTLVTSALAKGYAPWGTIDGDVLPEQLVEVFDRGEQAPVPLMVGFNAGEIRSLRFLLPPSTPTDPAAYEQAIRDSYGPLAETFLRLYPSSDLEESLLATPRDGLYGWTAERMVRRQARTGQPGFLYFFDHGYPAMDEANLHAFHASEIPYVFGNVDRTPPRWPAIPDTPVEHRLSDAMMAYWANFARTGAPTAQDQPDWPAYGDGRTYMAFEEGPVVRERLMPGMFETHEAVVCRRRVAGGIPWTWNFGVLSPPLPPQTPACP